MSNTDNAIEANTDLLFQSAVAGDLASLTKCVKSALYSVKEISVALLCASEQGHAECVAFLIPVSDPAYNNSQSLRWAAERGHAQVVELLIPVSDPKACDNEAIKWALEKENKDCVRLLLPVSDCKEIMKKYLNYSSSQTKQLFFECYKEYGFIQQKKRLLNQLNAENKSSVKRKM